MAGLSEVRPGRLPPLSPEGMMTETVGVLAKPIGVQTLDTVHDLAMEATAPVVKHAAVGHLMSEGMLECVLEIRKEARLIEELSGLEVTKAAAERLLTLASDRLEQGKCHVLADHCGSLQELLVRRW